MSFSCELKINGQKYDNLNGSKSFLKTFTDNESFDIVVRWDASRVRILYLHLYVKELDKCYVRKCENDGIDRCNVEYKMLQVPELNRVALLIFVCECSTSCKCAKTKSVEFLDEAAENQRAFYYYINVKKWKDVSPIEGEKCRLCKKLLESENQYQPMNCNHKFHETCITKCLTGKTKWCERPKCPVCKREINYWDYSFKVKYEHRCEHVSLNMEIEDNFNPNLFKEPIEDDCSICWEVLMTDYVELNCHHTFHKMCILEAYKRSNTCPYCRRFIFYKNIQEINY